MEPNQQKIVKLLSALIAASAIVVMVVLAVALNGVQTGTVPMEAGGGMLTGVTVTTTTAPNALLIPVAKPTMKAAIPKGFR